jgi:hypothetical protein
MTREIFPIKEMTREISPIKEMTRKISPIKEMTREISPIKEMTREISPIKEMTRKISPIKEMTREISPCVEMTSEISPFYSVNPCTCYSTWINGIKGLVCINANRNYAALKSDLLGIQNLAGRCNRRPKPVPTLGGIRKN